MSNPSEGVASEDAQQPAGSGAQEKHKSLRLALPILLVGGAISFVLALDGTIMSVALPQVQADLSLNDQTRSAVVTYYAFFHGLLLLLGGKAVDSWGYRRALLIGMAGFGAASLLGGTAHNGGQLLIARGAQGGFAALLAPAVLALISTSFFGARQRSNAFMIIGTTAICGTAAGLVLGGVLAEYMNWRWCLLLNVPLALLVLWLVAALLRNPSQRTRQGYDVPGSVLSTAAFISLGLAVYLQQEEDSILLFIGFLSLAAVLTAAFVIVEQRASAPLVPPSVLLDRTRALASLSSAIATSGILGGTLFLATYLEKLRDYDASKTGVSVLPILLGILVGGIAVTRLSERFGLRALTMAGALIAAAGLLLFGELDLTADYWAKLFPIIVALGIGLGILSVCLPDLALLGAQEGEAGSASAVFTAYGQVGGAAGTAFFTLVYSNAKSSVAEGGKAAELAGCSAAFTIAGVFLALVAPVVLFTKGRPSVG